MIASQPLTWDQALLLRLRAQGLHPDFAFDTAHDLAAHLCGLQAQDVAAGTLSFHPRSTGMTAADVDRARNTDRTVVRTWVMRNTLHVVAAEDVRWLLDLLSPRSIRQTRRRREGLGLSEPVVGRGIATIKRLLREGPLPRHDLLDGITQAGTPTDGQAGFHLLARAALEGIICNGPDIDGAQSFVLLADWLDDTTPHMPDDPLAELARRYLIAYAPAAPEDFAAWAGLTLTDARSGFAQVEADCVPVSVEGEPAWLLASQADWLDALPNERSIVRLLPRFDTYLLGWRSRDPILPAAHARRIHPGGGILHPAVLADGRIIARWKLARRSGGLTIHIEPFEALADIITDALAAEAADVGRFFGVESELTVAPPSA